MFDEYNKPEEERVPLPVPDEKYLQDIELIKKHYKEPAPEEEKKVPLSPSPIQSEKQEKPNPANFKFVDGGLAECPNCCRTFFPDRLIVHLKSCKPGKPLMPKKKKKVNMRWQSPKQKETHKTQFRMPLLGKGIISYKTDKLQIL